VPTEREADGLAMSSRNQLLSKEERKCASDLFKVLNKAKDKLIKDESIESVKNFVVDFFEHKSQVTLEYFEIVNSADLSQVTAINSNQKVSLCIAGYLGKVRLIDNLSLR
jgi:pantoate--beta-alanine ligase